MLPRNVALGFFAVTLASTLAPTEAIAQNLPRPGQDTAAARRALEQRLGRPISQSEILERLRQSGMTRAQAQDRLRQAGLDPKLADQYYDILEKGGSPPVGEPSPAFVDALGRIGLAGREPLRIEVPDSLALAQQVDSAGAAADTLPSGSMEVFGLRTFQRAGTQFQPNLYGPVDAGYRLGPGDEILLVLTGDVEMAYSLDVTREGVLFIPDVGQVSVNGLTLAQLEDVLYSRLARVYSGVSRSRNASTRFQVSLGRLRVNQIVVAGDVVRPGSYQVSSVSGLFQALYQARGPTADGSFRRIEVHRGGKLAQVADLYDFLIRGDAASDVRLEHNDRIFVPAAGAQARVEGAVRRPGIYELKPNESVRDLIAFAGGLRSDALVRRVQIDRILPPEEQQPGNYRRIVDVDLAQLKEGVPGVPIRDGDAVIVFSVSDQRRNRVWVEGEVRNPGMYEWNQGSTLWSMLERADGLGEQAYTSRAHVYRLIETDGARRLIQVSLERDNAGRPLHDLPLADNDSIVVLSRGELRTAEFVTISGFVKNPATYPLARGMTLKDAILAAGGFAFGANVMEAEVSRLTDPQQRTETTAQVIRVSLTVPGSDSGVNGNYAVTSAQRDDIVPHWLPDPDELELRHGDRVFIRRAPGYEAVREVRVSGEVLTPGQYVLTTREERLVDVVKRAGGPTPQAYMAGLRVVRDGRIVAADFQRALRDPADRSNILLVAGDSIHVPAYDPTVTVAGAVNFEARVLYVPGRGLDYYIDQAGGYTHVADKRRVTVTYASGERSSVSRSVFGARAPRVQPGSQIFVPPEAERRGFSLDQILTRTSALVSVLATAVIAYTQLR